MQTHKLYCRSWSIVHTHTHTYVYIYIRYGSRLYVFITLGLWAASCWCDICIEWRYTMWLYVYYMNTFGLISDSPPSTWAADLRSERPGDWPTAEHEGCPKDTKWFALGLEGQGGQWESLKIHEVGWSETVVLHWKTLPHPWTTELMILSRCSCALTSGMGIFMSWKTWVGLVWTHSYPQA